MPKYDEDDAARYGVRTRARRRTDASRPRGRRRGPLKRGSVSEILWGEDEERPTTLTEFTDPDMQRLFERGYFDTLVGQLRGGKEATVYLVRRGA